MCDFKLCWLCTLGKYVLYMVNVSSNNILLKTETREQEKLMVYWIDYCNQSSGAPIKHVGISKSNKTMQNL